MTIVYQIINSTIGKSGNIGLRASKIITDNGSIVHKVFARGSVFKSKNIKYPFFFELFSRFLNFVRIYFFRKFSSRYYDNLIFEKLIWLFYLRNCLRSGHKVEKKILHLWDYLPHTIKKFKSRKFKIILDVPIAPSLYAKMLNNKFSRNVFDIDERIISNEKKCFDLADLIIAPSLFVKKVIIDFYNIEENKIKLIPFGADFNQTFSKRIKNKNESFTFLYVGNLSIRKGTDILISAFNDSVFRNDKLILCGRVYPEISRILKKTKCKNIISTGYVKNINELYSSADIFVFPSLFEGSAKAVYEALSFGLPTIVSFQSGSIVDDKCGVLLHEFSSEALKNKMINLKLNNQKRKMYSINASKKIKQYTWLFYKKNLSNIYKNI